MLEQFCVYRFKARPVLILTNTTFHEIDQILIAPVKPREGEPLIRRLQIPIAIDANAYIIDFLDIATIFSHQISPTQVQDLGHLRHEIKSCLDFLIDGF
jgi:hypothetical protein